MFGGNERSVLFSCSIVAKNWKGNRKRRLNSARNGRNEALRRQAITITLNMVNAVLLNTSKLEIINSFSGNIFQLYAQGMHAYTKAFFIKGLSP